LYRPRRKKNMFFVLFQAWNVNDVSSRWDETTSIGMKHFTFKHETFHVTLCVFISHDNYTHRCMNQFVHTSSLCIYLRISIWKLTESQHEIFKKDSGLNLHNIFRLTMMNHDQIHHIVPQHHLQNNELKVNYNYKFITLLLIQWYI